MAPATSKRSPGSASAASVTAQGPRRAQNPWRAPIAGLLSWFLPGLGHFVIGERVRGGVLLATITVTFWSGIAIGGVVNTVDYQNHRLWFAAQLGSGGHTIAACVLRNVVAPTPKTHETPHVVGHWLPTDIGIHYTGVAGLLSILVILDAVGRGDRRGDRRGDGRGDRHGDRRRDPGGTSPGGHGADGGVP